MANQPRKRTPAIPVLPAPPPAPPADRKAGGPVTEGATVVLENESVEAASGPQEYDEILVLSDGGNYYLDGPVPVNPVRLTGSLWRCIESGACPWASVDEDGLVLRLANIYMGFNYVETLDDQYWVVTPNAHVWAKDATWLQGSDGTETAVPRG